MDSSVRMYGEPEEMVLWKVLVRYLLVSVCLWLMIMFIPLRILSLRVSFDFEALVSLGMTALAWGVALGYARYSERSESWKWWLKHD